MVPLLLIGGTHIQSKTGESVDFMEKNKSSKLCIKIDWISFCISETDLYTALHYMSFRYEDFKDLRHGGRGYRNMLQHNMYDINVYFGGSDAMGVHFEVKGGAVYDFV